MEYRNYVHKKTGQLYMAKGLVIIKVNGKWVDGISYKKYRDPETFKLLPTEYIRTKEDFLNKFEAVISTSEIEGV